MMHSVQRSNGITEDVGQQVEHVKRVPLLVLKKTHSQLQAIQVAHFLYSNKEVIEIHKSYDLNNVLYHSGGFKPTFIDAMNALALHLVISKSMRNRYLLGNYTFSTSYYTSRISKTLTKL